MEDYLTVRLSRKKESKDVDMLVEKDASLMENFFVFLRSKGIHSFDELFFDSDKLFLLSEYFSSRDDRDVKENRKECFFFCMLFKFCMMRHQPVATVPQRRVVAEKLYQWAKQERKKWVRMLPIGRSNKNQSQNKQSPNYSTKKKKNHKKNRNRKENNGEKEERATSNYK